MVPCRISNAKLSYVKPRLSHIVEMLVVAFSEPVSPAVGGDVAHLAQWHVLDFGTLKILKFWISEFWVSQTSCLRESRPSLVPWEGNTGQHCLCIIPGQVAL